MSSRVSRRVTSHKSGLHNNMHLYLDERLKGSASYTAVVRQGVLHHSKPQWAAWSAGGATNQPPPHPPAHPHLCTRAPAASRYKSLVRCTSVGDSQAKEGSIRQGLGRSDAHPLTASRCRKRSLRLCLCCRAREADQIASPRRPRGTLGEVVKRPSQWQENGRREKNPGNPGDFLLARPPSPPGIPPGAGATLGSR